MLTLLAKELRPYLSYREWVSLCTALRLPPLSERCNDCVPLRQLAADPATEQPTTLPQAPLGAYVVNKRHLHAEVPWHDQDAPYADGHDLAHMLRRSYLWDTCALESIYVHVKLPAAGIAELLAAVTHLIEVNALKLETLSITCELAQPFVAPPTPSTAPPLRTPAAAGEEPRRLEIRGWFLPLLSHCYFAVPLSISEHIQVPRMHSLTLRYLDYDTVRAWVRVGDDLSDQIKTLRHLQALSFQRLISASASTLSYLEIAGDLQMRQACNIFREFRFMPQLNNITLGWTCEAELSGLLAALQPSVERASDLILKCESQHPTVFKSLLEACTITQDGDKFIPHLKCLSSLPGLAPIVLPPRLPSLKRLSFSGPMQMGLSNLHLELYALLSLASQRGVHFQYGLWTATAAGVLKFRRSVARHPFFVIYRDPQSKLHHLHVRTLLPPNSPESAGTAKRRRALGRSTSELSVGEWATLLRYHFVDTATATRRRHRAAQRADLRAWDNPLNSQTREWDYALTQPEVGPGMTGKDLFLLEMWHLPVVCTRDFAETDTAEYVWQTFLTDADRDLWEQCAQLYVAERSAEGPLSFASVPPWWR